MRLGLRENLTLLTLERYAHPLLDPTAERVALREKVDEFGIRTGDLNNRAASLSGGNQQKLALAKFLHADPKIIVLDEPTRGVDVGAKRDIYFLIQRLAREGRGVVVISSELVELIGLCHRVVVMRGGKVQATLTADQLTEEELIAHANRHPLKPRPAPTPAPQAARPPPANRPAAVWRNASRISGRCSDSSCCASSAGRSIPISPPPTTC